MEKREFAITIDSVDSMYSKSPSEFIQAAIRWLNELCKARGTMFVYEVYQVFGREFKPSVYSNCYGWRNVAETNDDPDFTMHCTVDENGNTKFIVLFTAYRIIGD